MIDLQPWSVHPRIVLPAEDIEFDAQNAECECIRADLAAFEEQMRSAADDGGPVYHPETIHQNIISETPVILPQRELRKISNAVAAIHQVVRHSSFRDYVLGRAPVIARQNSKVHGVLMGFDFHMTPDGPKLIEINTNAGGALINAQLLRFQTACCDTFQEMIREVGVVHEVHNKILASFLAEWQAFGRQGRPQRIVIVDETPAQQYLYPELILFRSLFRAAGIEAEIVAPEDLVFAGGSLLYRRKTVDLVYNRLTDFYLEKRQSRALRDAHMSGEVLITSNPRHHALLANKKNFSIFSNADLLRSFNIPAQTINVLEQTVPKSCLVTSNNAEMLWQNRRKLFFKPVSGFGSRGAYRGSKLTKRVWQEILNGEYIAQDFVAPSLSPVKVDGVTREMKFDIRAYVYQGDIQLMAARRYQGQTTNMHTDGGGFASVYSVTV